MVQIILVLRQYIRYRNSPLRRLSVAFDEIIFVQASLFHVWTSKVRQNKICLTISSTKARRRDQLVSFQVGISNLQDTSMTSKNCNATEIEQFNLGIGKLECL